MSVMMISVKKPAVSAVSAVSSITTTDTCPPPDQSHQPTTLYTDSVSKCTSSVNLINLTNTMKNPHLFSNHSEFSAWIMLKFCFYFLLPLFFLKWTLSETNQNINRRLCKPVTCHNCIAFLFRKYSIVAAKEYWRLPSE